MKRNELLKSGEYVGLPKSLLADRGISPGAKLVLMSLINHLGDENETAWPGPATIGKETGMTRRGVQKALNQLVESGVVAKLGLSAKGTNNLVVNGVRQRTECASEQSALANIVR